MTTRDDYYQRIDGENLAPLWESLARLVPPQPTPRCQPAYWSWERLKPLILEAGRVISAREAERRVLILENPALRGLARLTNTLYGGVQMVLPGEIAPCHRHVQNALRLVLDGGGAYTAVDGERTLLEPGDYVITPNWTWHDHGNESDRPIIWLDGLDIPIVEFFEAGFAERYQDDDGHDWQPVRRPADYSANLYGHGLLPIDERAGRTRPMLNHPWRRTREVLDRMLRWERLDPCDGFKLRYVDPISGADTLRTIGAFAQLLPMGFKTVPYRCTAGTVFVPLEGTGTTRVGDATFTWGPRDVFVVPSWTEHVHTIDDGAHAVLFTYSDRPIQETLGLWREQWS